MAPEKLPGDDSLFLYHFFVDSMKGDAQKKTEKEKRTRKHLQHKKNCWNWQNSSLCVLCLVILYIFWKNWNTKGPMRVWRQWALALRRDVGLSFSFRQFCLGFGIFLKTKVSVSFLKSLVLEMFPYWSWKKSWVQFTGSIRRVVCDDFPDKRTI